MITTLKLSRFLNAYLSIKQIPDFSRNGLQVHGARQVTKIAVCVDACMDSFERARHAGCDCVIAHHGIFWKGVRDHMGTRAHRIAYLEKHGMTLYGIHLPLDMHGVVGNNAVLAQELGIEDLQPFGEYHGMQIGLKGRLLADMPTLVKRVTQVTTSPVVLHFGSNRIRQVAVVSGGGSSTLKDAYAEGVDCLITGEAPHHVYHEAKECRINLILAGHYETEVFGVIALAKLIKDKFNIPYQFIDVPTEI
ncbi:MAG: Nif3-like dinuclear metal center hexameric protein [Nanobdellota archaeon]